MSDPRPFPIPAANTPPPLEPGEPGALTGLLMLVFGLLLGTYFIYIGLQTIRSRRPPGNFFATPEASSEGSVLEELDANEPQSRGAALFWQFWGGVFLVLGLGLWGGGLYGLIRSALY